MTLASRLPLRPLLLAIVLVAPPVSAQPEGETACADGVETALRGALAGRADTRPAATGTRLQLACVAVPGDANGALHAIGSFRDDGTRSYLEGGEGEGYAVILATLAGDLRVVRHVTATAVEDATTLFRGGELALDTGFHDLAPGGGVVGVAVSHSAPGASAPDNQWGDEFALFVPEGAGFRRVLGLARSRQEAIDGCVSVQCRGARWIDTQTALEPGERAADGWRRVLMRLDAEEYATAPAVAASVPRSTSVVLVYRDGRYVTESGDLPPGSDYFGLLPW